LLRRLAFAHTPGGLRWFRLFRLIAQQQPTAPFRTLVPGGLRLFLGDNLAAYAVGGKNAHDGPAERVATVHDQRVGIALLRLRRRDCLQAGDAGEKKPD
jgi:hypothetical protein